MKKLLMLALLVLSCGVAAAQTAGTITFTLEATANGATVTPKLTWSTTPAASSCVGALGWAGAKAAAGTETLAATNKSATYRLDCTWTDGTAALSWTPPTTNTDGSALTDLKGVRVNYGTSATALTQTRNVDVPAVTTSFTGLPPATYFFTVTVLTNAGAESAPSNLVSKAVGSATGTKSVALSVNIPNPVVLTVQ